MAKKPRLPSSHRPIPTAPAGVSGRLLHMAGADAAVRPDFEAVARELETRKVAALPDASDAAGEAELARARAAVAEDPDDALRQFQLGDALRRAGRDAEARLALERCLALDPEATSARFMLAALGGAPVPEAMPPELVAAIFDAAAARFDQTLVGALKYRGPELIAKTLAPMLAAFGRKLDVLDAGCGTGLAAPHLAPHARRLDGVDLSVKMIEAAKARGVYDRLAVGELVTTLNDAPAGYDLVVAADVLVYVGALDATFAAAHRALRPGGLFAYTVESGTGGGFALSRANRYRHDPAYVEDIATDAGFILRHREDCTLRFESGKPVEALIYVHARRA